MFGAVQLLSLDLWEVKQTTLSTPLPWVQAVVVGREAGSGGGERKVVQRREEKYIDVSDVEMG